MKGSFISEVLSSILVRIGSDSVTRRLWVEISCMTDNWPGRAVRNLSDQVPTGTFLVMLPKEGIHTEAVISLGSVRNRVRPDLA